MKFLFGQAQGWATYGDNYGAGFGYGFDYATGDGYGNEVAWGVFHPPGGTP